ncbi:MAG: PDZ domain-containing protein [Anaerolineales bacterium]|nr:PDZ domain-containing protein [Anaerolineales bacterium]
MSDRQRHLVIILSILFVALLCISSVGVAMFLYRRAATGTGATATLAVNELISRAQGIIVTSIEPDSPAGRAGLQPETLLVGVDAFPLDVPDDLVRYMETYSGNGTVILTMRQGDSLAQLPLTLEPGSRHLGVEVRSINSPQPDPNATMAPDILPTFTPRPAPPVIAIVMPGMAGEVAGLQVGDVVTAVDGHAILSNEELVAVITGREVGTAVQLTVRRGADTLTIPVTLGPHPDDPARGFIGIELAGN